jgi:hypothetical protein
MLPEMESQRKRSKMQKKMGKEKKAETGGEF